MTLLETIIDKDDFIEQPKTLNRGKVVNWLVCLLEPFICSETITVMEHGYHTSHEMFVSKLKQMGVSRVFKT